MENKIKTNAQLSKGKTVESLPGIFRTTLAYNDETMLCHFRMKEGSAVPLHNHPAVQNGFVIRGKLRFFRKDKSSFIAETGAGYVFASNEPHGAEVLEYSEIIECFAPMRPDYVDD